MCGWVCVPETCPQVWEWRKSVRWSACFPVNLWLLPRLSCILWPVRPSSSLWAAEPRNTARNPTAAGTWSLRDDRPTGSAPWDDRRDVRRASISDSRAARNLCLTYLTPAEKLTTGKKRPSMLKFSNIPCTGCPLILKEMLGAFRSMQQLTTSSDANRCCFTDATVLGIRPASGPKTERSETQTAAYIDDNTGQNTKYQNDFKIWFQIMC